MFKSNVRAMTRFFNVRKASRVLRVSRALAGLIVLLARMHEKNRRLMLL